MTHPLPALLDDAEGAGAARGVDEDDVDARRPRRHVYNGGVGKRFRCNGTAVGGIGMDRCTSIGIYKGRRTVTTEDYGNVLGIGDTGSGARGLAEVEVVEIEGLSRAAVKLELSEFREINIAGGT